MSGSKVRNYHPLLLQHACLINLTPCVKVLVIKVKMFLCSMCLLPAVPTPSLQDWRRDWWGWGEGGGAVVRIVPSLLCHTSHPNTSSASTLSRVGGSYQSQPDLSFQASFLYCLVWYWGAATTRLQASSPHIIDTGPFKPGTREQTQRRFMAPNCCLLLFQTEMHCLPKDKKIASAKSDSGLKSNSPGMDWNGRNWHLTLPSSLHFLPSFHVDFYFGPPRTICSICYIQISVGIARRHG